MARDSDALLIEKWAESGDVQTPENAGLDRSEGWPAQYSQSGGPAPKRTVYNQIFKEITGAIVEINKSGSLLEWSEYIDYIANAHVVGSNGYVYRALSESGPETEDAINPVLDSENSKWELLVGDARHEVNNAIIAGGIIPDEADNTQLAAAIAALIADAIPDDPTPVGTAILCPGTTPLTGTLEADGSEISRTAYADLWAYAQASGALAVSEAAKEDGQFGPGDGAATFTLPDARGNFLRGWDNGRGIDSGRTIGSLQTDQIKSHDHYITSNSGGSAAGDGWSLEVSAGGNDDLTGSRTRGVISGSGSETRPRNIAWMICIKY